MYESSNFGTIVNDDPTLFWSTAACLLALLQTGWITSMDSHDTGADTRRDSRQHPALRLADAESES